MNKARKSRKIKTLNRLQQKLDYVRHLELYKAMLNSHVYKNNIVQLDVYFIEEKLQEFIDFLNKDKKCFLDLEKAKYDFIEYLINKSRKNILKG